jgi:glycosyltransferase involved in cell wall biosynthesis
MAPSPLFTVVIPTFGRPRFLAEALASVLAQTVTDLECIVVDDASPEPAELPTTDERVRLVRRATNGGPAASRNTGVAAATGRYLAFLDDDDRWEPGRLEAGRTALDRAPIAICWSRFDDEPGRPGRRLEGDVGDTILDDITPHLGATVVEREAWLPIDERYLGAEDNEWWLRTARAHRVATTEATHHVIRRHDEVRGRHSAAARVAGGRLLLLEHAGWFAEHPRAAAFRWKRVGLQAIAAGDRREARRALLRSARLHRDPALVKHLAGTLSPAFRRRPGVATTRH